MMKKSQLPWITLAIYSILLVVNTEVETATIPIIDEGIELLTSGLLDALVKPREDDVKYYLYTRNINGQQISRNDTSIINFDSSKQTIFVIHGWRDSYQSESEQLVIDAYLQSRDFNIFAIDWSNIAGKNYITAKYYVPDIGKIISEFIRFLIQNVGLEMEKTGLVGHSLGAHMAGIIGNLLGGSPDRVIGFDPAGPLYSTTSDEEKLTSDDAMFVEVIHTDAGILGDSSKLGDADYWPNGGTTIQPSCIGNLTVRCSHDTSFRYYSESLVTGGFRSVQCDNYVAFKTGSCNNNKEAYMGNDASDRSTGNFYLTTNSKPPYAQF